MSRIAIIEIYPLKKMNRSHYQDAHLRNSILLSKILGADLLCVESDFVRALQREYSVLILSYGALYAPFKLIEKLFEKNAKSRKYWITNEYNLTPIGSIKKYDHGIIANFEKQPYKKNVTSFHVINLNLLLSRAPNPFIDKNYDCVYYGTFRVGRKLYFNRYLQDDIFLSTSEKNFKRFAYAGCEARWIRKLVWTEGRETLNRFRYSLYLEDEFTHTCYNFLANRYYEAGFCNNVVFFDENCRATVEKSELARFDTELYFVRDYSDLQDRIKTCNENFEKYLAIQKTWRVSEPILRQLEIDKLIKIIYG